MTSFEYRRGRLRYRVRFYYTMGASLISIPIVFLGFSRNIYSIIDSLPFMNILFPTFQDFVIRGGLTLIPLTIIIGYTWTKTPFYRAQFEVPTEENPFTYRLTPGKESRLKSLEILNLVLLLRLYKANNLISSEEESAFQHGLDLHKHLVIGGDLREFTRRRPC